MAEKFGDYHKSFDKPDEQRQFKGHGRLDLVTFEDGTSIGRGVFEPGWKWSNDVKPIAGTDSCQADHTGYCEKGSMTIRMDSGEEFRIGPGEAYRIPPGHDAWVEGNEPCVMFDATGSREYAKPQAGQKVA